jgi:peptidoglycan/LPS O-acetylase OafA/YrhL
MEPSDDYIRLEEPKKKESFCSIFCACKCKDNFKSIYTRRESALYPLDGLRACAMLWVFIFHLAIFWNPYFEKCMGQANPIMRFISSGDAGVDIFFTLSGFLIAYILLKECAKYDGNIDYFNFIRCRFWRIWPAMALVGLCAIPEKGWYTLLDWVFLQNTILMPIECITHFWSIAVEMQLYLLSPLLMMMFYKMDS